MDYRLILATVLLGVTRPILGQGDEPESILKVDASCLGQRDCRARLREASNSWNSNTQTECDTLDPRCRDRLDRKTGAANPNFSGSNSAGKCNYQKLWLIPGSADTNCGRSTSNTHVKIDVSTVEIHPKVIQLPGCFTIRFVIQILDTIGQLPPSFFGRADYQWINLQEFSQLTCQNATNNGCGGFGNGCYYCDICNELHNVQDKADDVDLTKQQSRVVDQFKGLECPNGPGQYRLEKQFCFNDWDAFDEDNNCQIDLLEKAGEELGSYKNAFEALQSLGYGTLIAKFTLAHNATEAQVGKKSKKEDEIYQLWYEELEDRQKTWNNISNGHFEKFREWYIQYQKDVWHKNKYLPWLIFTNEMACLSVTFDVCDKKPTPVSNPGGSWVWGGGRPAQPSHQCI